MGLGAREGGFGLCNSGTREGSRPEEETSLPQAADSFVMPRKYMIIPLANASDMRPTRRHGHSVLFPTTQCSAFTTDPGPLRSLAGPSPVPTRTRQ